MAFVLDVTQHDHLVVAGNFFEGTLQVLARIDVITAEPVAIGLGYPTRGIEQTLAGGVSSVVSVANLTRADGAEFMRRAADVALAPAVTAFPLAGANEALARLRAGALDGAAVLVPERSAAQ